MLAVVATSFARVVEASKQPLQKYSGRRDPKPVQLRNAVQWIVLALGNTQITFKILAINMLLWLYVLEMRHNFFGYAEGVCIDGKGMRDTASGWHKTSVGDVQVGDFVGLAIFI